MDDKELIRLLKKKPSEGFDVLTAQYGGLLYTLVRGRLSAARFGSADIEDIVADTFSDFYLHIGAYRPAQCSIKSYLCVMARNRATDALRKAKITALPLEEAEDILDVSDTVEGDELRADLLRAIQALGEPDSLILIRKYYLGQPSKEIAAALSMSVSNVDTRSHRAIDKLRKSLGSLW